MTYIINAVCTGNICRSAMAKVVLKDTFEGAGKNVTVDSSGVSAEEQGHSMDRRAVRALIGRGFDPGEHTAQRITEKQIAAGDLFLAMTASHAEWLLRLGADLEKVYVYRQFETTDSPKPFSEADPESISDLADPWSGTQADFEEALDQIVDSADNILEFVNSKIG